MRKKIVGRFVCLGWAILSFASFAFPASAAGIDKSEAAYRDEIVTPHWLWVDKHAGNTIRALFITEELAAREPYELSQRFDIDATVIPALGVTLSPGRKIDYRRQNRLDEPPTLTELLKKDWDIIVMACRGVFTALSSEERQLLIKKIRDGTPLVVYNSHWLNLEYFKKERLTTGDESHDKGEPEEDPDAIARCLPVKELFYRGPLKIPFLPLGRGKIAYVHGYNTHWTFRNALLGVDPVFGIHKPASFINDPVSPEMHYAVAARWLRWAAGKESSYQLQSLSLQNPVSVGDTAEIKATLNKDARKGDRLEWHLHSPYGEVLKTGDKLLPDSEKEVTIPLELGQSGRLAFRCRLLRDGRVYDYGALLITVNTPASFKSLSGAKSTKPEDKLLVTWQIDGSVTPEDTVILQVYDSDGRLVTAGRYAANVGKASLQGWLPRAASHRLRALLQRGSYVMEEKWEDIHLSHNRATDTVPYHVNVWGFERGDFQDLPRYLYMRQLGIDAISTGGRNNISAGMAHREGLRIIPTNIRHPSERKQPNWDENKAGEELETFVESVAPYNPLGYMLGDEPGNIDVREYTQWARSIIHRKDPGSRVGWSGVWMGFDNDVPEFFQTCDFVTSYSPFHLYTPNLWMGVERDLYRSFTRDTAITTCWTHYAPWRDDEPYSRTVPWLWLFEGLNGVSYFSSDGSFAILPSDLQITHETRWWSEEVKEIKKGIGEQLIGMERDTGNVRILFSRGASGADIWARTLNRAHIPYRFMSRTELLKGVNADIKLLICPNATDLSDQEIHILYDYAAKGGIILATAPLGILNEGKFTEPDRLQKLFGIIRTYQPSDMDEWKKTLNTHRNIGCTINWKSSSEEEHPNIKKISGTTMGEYGLKPDGADVLAEFVQLGSFRRDEGVKLDFLQRLFATPAVFLKKHGQGASLYLNFQPDLETLSLMVPWLAQRSDISMPDTQVTVNGKSDNTVYLYPFTDMDGTRMVGVIRDYFSFYGDVEQWRVPPEWEVEGGKETRLYFHHGPYIWMEHPAEFNTAEPAHIYDVRRSHYIGYTTNFRFSLQAGRPELFALLPYKVLSVKVEAPEAVVQGDTIKVNVSLLSDRGKPNRHVVHLSLTGPDGRQMPGDSFNVHTESGKGLQKIQIPLNAETGRWQIKARDSVTGTSTTASFRVEPSGIETGPVVVRKEIEVRHIPLDWPHGSLKPAKVKEVKKKVEVTGAKLEPFLLPKHWGKCQNHKGLRSNFTLKNEDAYYKMQYAVCNDAKAHGFDDTRQIVTFYPPGLGIVRPNPMPWYYNGYIIVYFDDFNLSHYAASDIKEVEAEDNGRVDVHFSTPKGDLTLSFAMTPDSIALFQELRAKPSVPVKKITIQFRRYDWGGPKLPYSFMEVEQEHNSWALTGDRLEDREFGRGKGPASMLVIPGQWDKVNYHPPHPILEKEVDLPAGEEIKLHWALYLFPEHSNVDALKHMRENSHSDRDKLIEIFKVQAEK
jgi:hypothetical protein